MSKKNLFIYTAFIFLISIQASENEGGKKCWANTLDGWIPYSAGPCDTNLDCVNLCDCEASCSIDKPSGGAVTGAGASPEFSLSKNNFNNNNENPNPSYIKLYKGEKEILSEMSQDFIGMDLSSSVNDLIFQDGKNLIDKNYPNSELDLFSIKLEGSEFSLGDNAEILFNDKYSIICHDKDNISSYTFMKGNFTYRDNEKNTNETNEFMATIFAKDILYYKNYTVNTNTNSDNKTFNLTGDIAFIWATPSIKFSNNKTSENIQKFIQSKFEDLFYKNYSMQIEAELDKGLKNYYKNTYATFDEKINFILSDYLSSLKSINHTINLNLNDIKLNFNEKTDNKTMEKRDYSGYYSSYDAIKNKKPEQIFDIYNSGLDTKNLKNAIFLDKFLFEYLLDTYEFDNFFIRREANELDFPKALNIDLDVREISKILPEVSRLFSLTKKAYLNFAYFSPRIFFSEGKLPQIKLNLDFTFYVKNFDGNFKQIFTCQSDLFFDVGVKNSGNFMLNWAFDLKEVRNLKMSNDFSYVEVDYLKYLIEEIVSYGIEKNGGMLIEKDLDLSKVFEEKFLVKYFEAGVLLYEYNK